MSSIFDDVLGFTKATSMMMEGEAQSGEDYEYNQDDYDEEDEEYDEEEDDNYSSSNSDREMSTMLRFKNLFLGSGDGKTVLPTEVVATTFLLKNLSKFRNELDRNINEIDNQLFHIFQIKAYGSIIVPLTSMYANNFLIRVEKQLKLGIFKPDGSCRLWKPFKFKLDKDTTAKIIITQKGNACPYLVVHVSGKNKTYHWLKLRREILQHNNPLDQLHIEDESESAVISRYMSGKMANVQPMNGSKNTWNRLVSPHKKEIYNYITSWSDCGYYYRKFNKSYRTGILLEGPTGTGKSTAAKAIAELLSFRLINIDFSQPLDEQFAKIPNNTVVMMEELETKIGKRVNVSKDLGNNSTKVELREESKQIDLTGTILEWMDGRRNYDGVVFIATTNDKSKLDEAIFRKGRFDKTYHMDNFDKELAEEMCRKHDVPPSKILKGVAYPVRPADVESKINEYFMLKILNKRRVLEVLKNEKDEFDKKFK